MCFILREVYTTGEVTSTLVRVIASIIKDGRPLSVITIDTSRDLPSLKLLGGILRAAGAGG